MMGRAPWIVGFVVVAAAAAVAGYNRYADPVGQRRADLDRELRELRPGDAVYHVKRDLDYERIQSEALQRSDLWAQIVAPPPPPPPPPNLAEMAKGIQATRYQLGSGDTARVKILTQDDKRGKFYSIGETIYGLTLSKIEPQQIELSLERNGKVYTLTLPRGR